MIQVCKNSIAKQFYMNFCILELQVPRVAHRNGSCNESKTDMLAEAAASARDVCSLNLHMLVSAAAPLKPEI